MNWKRGDVCLVDLGIAAKTRPCVILSVPNADGERNMSVVAPLTSQPRGGRCEVKLVKPRWLMDESVVNLIGLGGVDNAKLGRFLGAMTEQTMADIDDGLARMFGLDR